METVSDPSVLYVHTYALHFLANKWKQFAQPQHGEGGTEEHGPC